MKEIIETLILTILTAGLTWMFARKKNIAEINKIEVETEKVETEIETASINNLRNLIIIYKEVSEDLKKELQQVHNECMALRLEVIQLRKENLFLKQQLETLTKMIKKEKQ